MLERLREIPSKILEWWNKFSSRQKTIIVSASAGVIVAFVILITLLTRPVYEVLVYCESAKEASQIIELLQGEGIETKTSDDGLQISVLKQEKSQATLLLGANDIPTAGYELSNVTSGGFSTTEADKTKQYKLYLESLMETDLRGLSNIKNATVQLNLPDNDGTLISKQEDSSAAIWIEPDGVFNQEHAANVARFVQTALGNKNLTNITIIDNKGNLLFSGDEEFSMAGNTSNQMTLKQETEAIIQNEVKRVLMGTNEFDSIEVTANLELNFSISEETEHRYTPADGQTQGVLSHESTYSEEATGTSGGVPGTDSNGEDGTTYGIEDYGNSNSSASETKRDYLPNEFIKKTTIPAGGIRYANSSISVAAIKYKVLKEKDAKTQGLLDGVKWEEYKLANNERVKLQTDEELVNMVAKASGVPVENVSFVAYEEPMFVDKEAPNVSVADVSQVSVIIIILALLIFVILRSMRTEKPQEQEEELSVEQILESTPEEQLLDEISGETKSETRLMIEKFVDDNPEAVANLLRNWLNEDWA